MNDFNNKIEGCKVNLSTRGGIERFVGKVSKIYDDTWIEIIPFAETDAFKEKMKANFPDVDVSPTPVTIYKRLSTIDTFIILDKPEEFLDGNENKNTEDRKEE